jgi:hypothetical protein
MCLSVSGALRGLRPDHGRETLAVRWTLLAFLQVRELTFSRVGLRDKRFAKASDRLQVYGIKHAEAQFLHTYRPVGSGEKGVEREVAFGPGCSASLFIAVCGMVVLPPIHCICLHLSCHWCFLPSWPTPSIVRGER